jgi:hypothetical protein
MVIALRRTTVMRPLYGLYMALMGVARPVHELYSAGRGVLPGRCVNDAEFLTQCRRVL